VLVNRPRCRSRRKAEGCSWGRGRRCSSGEALLRRENAGGGGDAELRSCWGSVLEANGEIFFSLEEQRLIIDSEKIARAVTMISDI
jgi:hypothetical protein